MVLHHYAERRDASQRLAGTVFKLCVRLEHLQSGRQQCMMHSAYGLKHLQSHSVQ